MELHNLKPAEGSTKNVKRIARGEGSGHGGTATRGNKGAQSNTGYKSKRGHEGGQMPIQRRMPKRGFKNPFRVEYKVFNISQLDELITKYELDEVSVESLYLNSLISRTDLVKILGEGELTTKVPFKVNAVSKTAQAAIEKAGIKLELI